MFPYPLLLLFRKVSRILPRPISSFIISLLAGVAFISLPQVSWRIGKNLILAGKKKGLIRGIFQTHQNFLLYLRDFFLLNSPREKEIRWQWVNAEATSRQLREIIEKFGGLIVFSAHLGHWELGVRILEELKFAIGVIYQPHRDERWEQLFLSQRLSSAGSTQWLPNNPRVLHQVKAILELGGIVTTASDYRYGLDHGVPVDFFGRKLLFPRGVAFLAWWSKKPLIGGFVVRQRDAQYRIVFTEPFFPRPEENQEEAIRRLTQLVAASVEKFVHDFPEQWTIFVDYQKVNQLREA